MCKRFSSPTPDCREEMPPCLRMRLQEEGAHVTLTGPPPFQTHFPTLLQFPETFANRALSHTSLVPGSPSGEPDLRPGASRGCHPRGTCPGGSGPASVWREGVPLPLSDAGLGAQMGSGRTHTATQARCQLSSLRAGSAEWKAVGIVETKKEKGKGADAGWPQGDRESPCLEGLPRWPRGPRPP